MSEISDINWDEIRFDERGLIPAIVQDAATREVLTLAYMNRESLERTLKQSRHGSGHDRETNSGTRA